MYNMNYSILKYEEQDKRPVFRQLLQKIFSNETLRQEFQTATEDVIQEHAFHTEDVYTKFDIADTQAVILEKYLGADIFKAFPTAPNKFVFDLFYSADNPETKSKSDVSILNKVRGDGLLAEHISVDLKVGDMTKATGLCGGINSDYKDCHRFLPEGLYLSLNFNLTKAYLIQCWFIQNYMEENNLAWIGDRTCKYNGSNIYSHDHSLSALVKQPIYADKIICEEKSLFN